MSVLDTLDVPHDGPWALEVLKKAEALAHSKLDKDEASAVSWALESLDHDANLLEQMGKPAFLRGIVNHLAGRPGKVMDEFLRHADEDTKLEFISKSASYEERRAASKAATKDLREADKLLEAWASFQDLLEDIGDFPLLKVLPFLAAVM